MKKVVLVAASALLVAGSAANAADLPAKAPILKAPVAAATNWTGLYINGGWGYGIWSADTTTASPTTGLCVLCVNQEQGGKGWLGVIGVGYDYQFAPNWVAGVFTDFNFSSLKGTIQDQGPFFAGDIKETSAWAAGGRVGYLVTPDALVYLNAGYSNARFSSATMVFTFPFPPLGFSTPSFNTNGWFIGGGTETTMNGALGIFGPGWFWRNEYRYAAYSNKTLPDTNGPAFVSSINFKPFVQTITSQLVYKLNTGGPTYPAAASFAPASWSGFYVNAGLGYGAWAADTTTQNPFTGACILCGNQEQGGKGWLGVVGLGYDFHLMPKIVAGVFADFNFSNLKGSIQDQGPFFEGDIKQTSAWAAGARIGWLVTPQILSYWNAGFTSARFSGTTMVFTFTGLPPSGNGTPGFTDNGWFLGGGVELAVAPNWFWRNEYRYANYSNKTIPDTGALGPLPSINFKPAVQTFTTQAVYKFNWL